MSELSSCESKSDRESERESERENERKSDRESECEYESKCECKSDCDCESIIKSLIDSLSGNISDDESGDDPNDEPKIVKIGDDREQAEWAKDFYSKYMNASTLADVNRLIANMPEEGPIPYELKNIFYIVAKYNIKSSNRNGGLDDTIIVGVAGKHITIAPIIYGVEINYEIIVRTANRWVVYEKYTKQISFTGSITPDIEFGDHVEINTFNDSNYFTCDKPGKYFINDKVFELQNNNDIVYKDRYLIRYDSNYTIVPPVISDEVAEKKCFTCELVGHSLNESVTLVNYNSRYWVAKCQNLGAKNIFKVCAENYYMGIVRDGDFSKERLLYINDVEAICVEPENEYINLHPGETFQFAGRTFKNHYLRTINIITIIEFEAVHYALTELGLIYEISQDSSKHTKPATASETE